MKTGIVKISQNQIITFSIWFVLIVLSTVLLFNSLHFVPSLYLYISTMILCTTGLFQSFKYKYVYIFSPLLQTIYASFFYCNLIGLFYFSKFNFIIFFELPSNNETFLTNCAILYFIYILCVFVPFLIYSVSGKKNLRKIKYFSKNFDNKKLKKYLTTSCIIVLTLLFLLFIVTGFTPTTALFNLLDFRHSYTKGVANYIYVLLNIFMIIHIIILSKLFIIDEKKSVFLYRNASLFFSIYIFWCIMSGARGTILTLFMCILYTLASKKNLKINFKHILIVGLLGLSILFLMTVLFQFRNQQKQNSLTIVEKRSVLYESLNRVDGFSNSIRYFDYLNSFNKFMFDYDEPKFVKQIVSQCTNLIPRSILSGKGYPISGEITQIIFPDAFNNNVNIVFGGIVNSFYTGGIIGIIIESLLMGCVLLFMEVPFRKLIEKDMFFVNYFVWGINMPIRFFQIGILNTAVSNVIIFNILITIIITSYLSNIKLKIKV